MYFFRERVLHRGYFFLIIFNHSMFSRFDELEILNPSFKIDSVVSQHVTDEFNTHKYDNLVLNSTENTSVISEITNENVIEYPVSPVNEYFWYSKPIVMNLTTQQIFFQLSTENNGMLLKIISVFVNLMQTNLYILDNIVLSIESILSKLNCLWRKPSA